MDQENEKYRVNRAILSISKLGESDEYVYWRKKSPIERLEELEINRQIIYGYGSTPPRLQRVLEVVDFANCYRNRSEVEIDGVPVKMISLPDLLKNKKAAGRHKDLDDVEHLSK